MLVMGDEETCKYQNAIRNQDFTSVYNGVRVFTRKHHLNSAGKCFSKGSKITVAIFALGRYTVYTFRRMQLPLNVFAVQSTSRSGKN